MKLLSKSKRRFSSECCCRLDCIDQIFYFIKGVIAEKNSVESSNKNTSQTLAFLKENNFSFSVYIPLFSLLSPFIFKVVIIYRKHCLFSKEKFRKIECGVKKRAFLYHLTAYQLYRIREEWTHCVCEFFEINKILYYDPYLNILKREYSSLRRYKIPTHDDLLNFSSIKIVIW